MLAFLIAGCAADDSKSSRPVGASDGPSFSASGGQEARSDGTNVATGGSGATNLDSSGASSASWNFCLTSLTVSMR